MVTKMTKRPSVIDKKWYLINAENVVLGRLSTKIAELLRGKHKPDFSPDVDCGDNVIVINASKVKLTGNKITDKLYKWHTGYPGGIKERKVEEMLKRKPEYIIFNAVKGMLPKNKLSDKILTHLKIYADKEHPHTAQKPEEISI